MPRERRCLSHPLLAPGSCFCRAASLRMPVRPSRNLPLCPAQPPTVPSETEAEAEEDCPAGVGWFAGTPRPFLTQILLHLSPLSRPPQGLKTQSQPSVTAEGPFPKESALSHECIQACQGRFLSTVFHCLCSHRPMYIRTIVFIIMTPCCNLSAYLFFDQ